MFLYTELPGGYPAYLYGKIDERIKLGFCRNVKCFNKIHSSQTFCSDCLINLKKNMRIICPISNSFHSFDEYIYPCLNAECQFNTYKKDSFCDFCEKKFNKDIENIKDEAHICRSPHCKRHVAQYSDPYVVQNLIYCQCCLDRMWML